ncbi:hypothetical protein D3C85_1251350 [compost metagenome]
MGVQRLIPAVDRSRHDKRDADPLAAGKQAEDACQDEKQPFIIVNLFTRSEQLEPPAPQGAILNCGRQRLKHRVVLNFELGSGRRIAESRKLDHGLHGVLLNRSVAA